MPNDWWNISKTTQKEMDVTIQNFQEVYEEINKIMPNCSYVSMDCEFTGLEKRYQKKKKRKIKILISKPFRKS